jgi:Domain of unknown function (DUF4091)/Family of unknown function (DUF6067)
MAKIMNLPKLLIILILSVFHGALAAQITQPLIQIPVAGKAPVIDGNLSVEEWKDATLVDDYTNWTLDAYSGDKVETHIQYDRENIYVAFKSYIRDKTLFNNSLEEKKPIDSHLWGRNHFGVQIVTDAVSVDIKASPSLSRMDFKNDALGWNGSWTFAAAIHEGDWTGEFKIPFADLGLKAPPEGKRWLILFSSSNPSGISADWRGYANFAKGKSVQASVGRWINPSPGANSLPVQLRNNQSSAANIKCHIQLLPFKGKPGFAEQMGQSNTNGGMVIGLTGATLSFDKQVNIAAGQTVTDVLPYFLPAEGNYYATVACMSEQGDTIFQTTGYWFTISPNRERLKALNKSIAAAVGTIPANTPANKQLQANYQSLVQELNLLTKQADVYWQSKPWEELTAMVNRFETKCLQFQQQVKFYALDGFTSSQSFGALVSHAVQKIKRDELFTGSFSNEINITAARNERESFQLNLMPFGRAMQNITIELKELTGESGKKIALENIELSLVDYNNIKYQASYATEKTGWYPDPLLPVEKSFELAGTEINRPLWITINVPANAAAGNYKGTIAVTANNETCNVAVHLKVYGFELPLESHLKTHTWNEIGNMQDFYNVNELPIDWYLNYCDVLLKNRLNPSFAGVNFVNRKPLANGKYDFSKCEKVLRYAIGKGLTRFSMIQMKKGDYTTAELAEEYKFIGAYAKFLKEKGWLNRALVELWDEPTVLEWEAVKERAERIRKISPEIKTQLFCSGGDPYKFWDTAVSAKYGLLNLIDLWMPLRAVEAPEVQKSGHEVWTYFATLARSSAPNFYIESPAMYQRIIPWYCWLYGVDGFEHWSTTYYWRNTKKGQPMSEKWPNTPWDARTYHDFHGEGQMVYPGANGKFLPSIRLELFREGMDDFEYLFLLRQLVENYKGNKTDSRYLAAKNLLDISGSVLIKYPDTVQETLENTMRYPNEPERLLQLRDEIGQAIEGWDSQ